jgi:hypothetical protein|tara:strand:+ start:213 stop:1301 length:1089 start_codon:yes stop_codon:yes gene_type:complete
MSAKKQSKVKRACVDCHFISISQLKWGGHPEFPTYTEGNYVFGVSEREQARKKEDITTEWGGHTMTLGDSEHVLTCYKGFWTEFDENITKKRYGLISRIDRYRLIVEKDRGYCPDFLEYSPSMSFDHADRCLDEKKGLQSDQNEEGVKPEESYQFSLSGNIWVITYADETIRLQDSLGLKYIHYLLLHPEKEIFALELKREINPVFLFKDQDGYERLGNEEVSKLLIEGKLRSMPTGTSGAKEEILDDQAVKEYKDELKRLTIKLNDAEELSQDEEAEEIRKKIEILMKQLSAGHDHHGQPREFTDESEKARVSVSKAVRASLEKIKDDKTGLPALWRHFCSTLSAGISCSYKPEKPMPWNL